jgi:NADPH:quinone reductase-like Zn-dependent oxidoreductase
MKALALDSFDGGPKVLDVPDSVAGPGEVLVRVAAASLNAFDVGVAAGSMKDFMPYEFPAVIGSDVAGRVEAVGDGVEGFAVGERVFGMMGTRGAVHDGSFAELANPQAASIAFAPEGLPDADAGSLGVAGGTAMSTVEAVDPSEGSTVLIIGATGGVGSFAIQLAALRGAHVIATVRPGDEAFVNKLGAAETVDYTDDLSEEIRARYPSGIDAVIDAVNRDRAAFAGLVALVHGGGHATSVVGGAGDSTEIGGVAVSNSGGNPAYLPGLADLVVQGKLQVAIRRTYPLDDAAQAVRDFADHHTVGKLVLTMGRGR